MQESIDRFMKDGKIIVIPKKEKMKKELFDYVITHFEKEKDYSEKKVNTLLLEFYPDYSLLRRYLVDYGYLKRDKYGHRYRMDN